MIGNDKEITKATPTPTIMITTSTNKCIRNWQRRDTSNISVGPSCDLNPGFEGLIRLLIAQDIPVHL